jgi:hypothetical protein
VFQKKLRSGIPNVTVWGVMKTLNLKEYKLSIFPVLERWIVCVSVFITPHNNIWNTIVKLFLKHRSLQMEVTLNDDYLT